VTSPGDPPAPLEPPGPDAPCAQRMRLARKYWHLLLKFDGPPTSRSGAYEATWAGGEAIAATEGELIATVLTELGDCGDEKHTWVTVSTVPDPVHPDRALVTQRLHCPYCDPRARVITDPPYLPSAAGQERRG
jgi:hypothetical protein